MMTIKQILCPVDFSDASSHAVEQAVVLARYYKADLTALHVVRPIVPSLEDMTLVRLRQEVGAFFQSATAAGIALRVDLDVGDAVGHILDRSSSLPADVIVMGTHGASGFEHLVLGSVTEKVLRKARCPVFTVPPHAQATSRLPFRHLLCSVDFSDVSLRAVQSALSLAHESGASLTLLHVLEWPWDEPPAPSIQELPLEQGRALAEFRRYSEDGARKRLESLIPATLSTPTVATLLRNGKAYDQILAVAAEKQSDLIVMGVQGRNPLDMTLFGSTTNQVVRRATCPVLTLH